MTKQGKQIFLLSQFIIDNQNNIVFKKKQKQKNMDQDIRQLETEVFETEEFETEEFKKG